MPAHSYYSITPLLYCGAVSFADVTSENVVGYQNYDLVKGYNLYAPTFVDVGGATEMDIQTMKLIGESVTGGGSNFICPLDEKGMSGDSICWYLPEDGTGEAEGCWFDDLNWCKWEGVTIKEGQGFYIYNVDEGLKIQTSGAVKLTQYEKPMVKGYNVVGNPSPVDLDVQKIKIVGESVTGGGSNFICPLDEKGMSGDSICWYLPEDGTGETEGCWFDDLNWCKWEGVTVKAGEGLYVYCVDDGLKFTVPSALGTK